MSITQFRGSYHFLSNFYTCAITYKEKIYPSAEHLYQALKTKDEASRTIIRQAKTSQLAKKLGRDVCLRENWEQIKDNLMYMVVRLKFLQTPLLQKLLLDTKEQSLTEGNYWCDNYWGNCSCYRCKQIKGKNKLGKILMTIRELTKLV